MKKQITILCLLSLVSATVIAEELQHSISGLVLDQDNNPVAGITLRAIASQSDELLTTKTDSNGNFSFPNAQGDIKITALKKDGYVCTSGQIRKANGIASQLMTESSQGNPQPILIRMHKKAGPVFLRHTRGQFRIKANSLQGVFLDMQSGRDISVVAVKSIEKGEMDKLSNALKVQSMFDPVQQEYQLTLTCLQEETGIIVTDERLYEAPADGYTQQTTLEILYSEDRALESSVFIYLKSNDKKKKQPCFSGMKLEIIAGKAELIADAQIWTNPKGGRNLEYDEKFQQKYIAERLGEIRTAVEDDMATEDQIQEMHELMMMQRTQHHNRWDFDGNRRRAMQQKREKERDATGRTRPRKRTIEKEQTQTFPR